MSTIATSKDALAQAKTRMEKAVEDFRKDLSAVRTGRANVALLDHVRVDYHGTPMPHQSTGNAECSRPGDDCDLALGSRRRALDRQSDSHLRSRTQSHKRRESGARADSAADRRPPQRPREAHAQGLENHRTAVRNIRRDIKEAVEKLEKEKKISEDDKKRSLDELEKLTHSETKKIEDLAATKEREVLEMK